MQRQQENIHGKVETSCDAIKSHC